MKRFLQIIKDELKLLFADQGALMIMVVGVILYSIFYSIPYANEVVKDVPIGVFDMDNSELSREFVKMLNSGDSVKVTSRPISIEEAKTEFYDGKIKSYVVIPKDFQRDILRGKQSNISMYADSSYLIIYKQVANGIMTTAGALGAKIEIGKLMKQGIPKQVAMSIKQPFDYVQIPLFNPSGGYASYVYPIILILILQQTILIGIGVMQGGRKERQEAFCGTNESRRFVLFAKSTAYVLLYLLYSIFYFLIYPALVNYKIHYNFPALILILVPFLYASVFLAFTLVSAYKERESAMLLLVVTSILFIFLPGFIWPKESIPLWLNALSWLIPATTGIDALIKINQMGATFIQVFHDFCVQIGLCALYFYLAERCVRDKGETN